MSDQSIELKSPKLGYIPIRQFLIIGSILGILYAVSFISAEYTPTIVSYTFAALTFLFNACLFYGALKNNGIALGCCQKVLRFSMVLLRVAFFFMPALAASFVSSDYDKELKFSDATNYKIKELLVDILGLRPMQAFVDFVRKHGGSDATARQKFEQGVVFGGMWVVALIVYTSLFYVEYVIIKRLRKFITARKGMYEHQILP
ncbi:hypothetical protein B9Z55_021032 [Caenorhabditis nigoni]|uniref:Uncharacterized protein n=1 Tax=Caenorhabditis nigoni TaxID=1611254 RepID=A0A2G5TQF3_9PELO|nr:hypothetical protein B9Z55_021032 [Caenorhabditis nigoni]